MNWVFNFFFFFLIITLAKKKKKRLEEGLSIPTTNKNERTSEKGVKRTKF